MEDARSGMVSRIGESWNVPIGAFLEVVLLRVFSAPQTVLAFSDLF